MDRYIAKSFMGFFLGSLIALVTLFLAVDALSLLMRDNPPIAVLIKYYVYLSPFIIYQMLPVACLAGTLFTLSGMNKSHELTALFSIGNSLARVSAPILIIVGAITVFSFWLGDRIVPVANSKKNFVKFVEIKKKPGSYSTVKSNKVWYRVKNIIFNLKTYNAEKDLAQGVTFYYFDDAWNLIQTVIAKEASIQENHWRLKEGSVTLFAEDTSFPLNQVFSEKVISLENISKDIEQASQLSDQLSTSQLKRFIKKNKEAGLDTLRYEVDYHAKFGFSLAAFVLSFIGIPFSVTSNRSAGRFLNVGICLGLAFAYWALFSSGLALGKHGVVPPAVAGWLPNGFMLALTTVFLLRMKK